MKPNIFYLLFFISCTLLFVSCKQKSQTDKDNLSELTSNEDSENKAVSDGDKGDGYKRYEIKSGIVEYETMGTMNSGKETLYFDDYGRKEAKVTQTTVSVPGMNIKQTSNQLTIMDGDWMYSIDLDKKTGFKMKPEMLEKMAKNKGNDLGKAGKEIFEQMGGKKIGEETVLGKNCEIWEMSSFGTKTWIWKNLSLKTETDMMGMKINQLATKIETNVSIPAEKFDVPSDVTISDENPMEKLKEVNKELDKLKDLDANKMKEAQEVLKKMKEK